MPSQVVHVRTRRRGRRREPARRDRPDPGRAQGHARVPGRGGGGRGAQAANPAAARPRPDRPPVRDDRPADVDGPRPGAAPRARRRRLRRALRDRRRRGVRVARRPGRPRGAPPRRDAVRRRLQGPAAPAGALEGAASLLPDQVRPALLWTIKVDATGEGTDVTRRAGPGALHGQARLRAGCRARSTTARRRDADAAPGGRRAAAGPRGGPRRGVAAAARAGGRRLDDRWHLEFRTLLPGRGVERPDLAAHRVRRGLADGLRADRPAAHAAAADPRDVQRLHRTARALGIDWPAELLYPDFIRTLDPASPHHAAMVVACTRLLRGSGYVGFDGELPEQPQHSALASEYAHVTAPLRRLGDRYAGEICLALCAGTRCPAGCWTSSGAARRPAGVRPRAHHYERRDPRPRRGRRPQGPVGRPSTAWSSTSTTRTTSAAPSPCRTRPSRPGHRPPRPAARHRRARAAHHRRPRHPTPPPQGGGGLACRPVLSRLATGTIIHLRRPLPAASSGLPAHSGGQPSNVRASGARRRRTS